MSDLTTERELLDEVQAGAEAMALLARDDEVFRAVVDAFRAQDGESMQRLLERHGLAARCEIVCHWLRSKECVLLCLELAGPAPVDGEQAPDADELAKVAARVATDEELVEEIAAAIYERDGDAWKALIERNDLGRYGHLLCNWVCTIHFRLVCHVVCSPDVVRPSHLIPEIMSAGAAIEKLVGDERGFTDAIDAVRAGDCVRLGGVLGGHGAGRCLLICELFCCWRCVVTCLHMCRSFPLDRLDSPIDEMIEFARAGGRLAEEGVLDRLTAAVLREDVEGFERLVKGLDFGPFCVQLCWWICFLRCCLFCRCVCPQPDTHPLFTHVGIYKVDDHVAADGFTVVNDFRADGTTTVGELAFSGVIPLEGILPDALAHDPTEYRFRVAKYPALSPRDAVAPLAVATEIGQLQYRYWHDTGSSPAEWRDGAETYWVNNPGAHATIAQPGGAPPLTPSTNVDIGPGGWIPVPRDNDYTDGGTGRFTRNERHLLKLATTELTNETFDLRFPAPGVRAGDSLAAANRSEAPTYRISFEWRVVGSTAVAGNELETIALSNTHYSYTRHPEWAGGDRGSISMCSLDIGELIAPGASGCDRLQDRLHALFTCYHPYIGQPRVWFEGNAPLPAPVDPPVVSDEAASGTPGLLFDITTMAPCAYILHLDVPLRLTDGWSYFGTADYDYIAFCKDKPRVPKGETP